MNSPPGSPSLSLISQTSHNFSHRRTQKTKHSHCGDDDSSAVQDHKKCTFDQSSSDALAVDHVMTHDVNGSGNLLSGGILIHNYVLRSLDDTQTHAPRIPKPKNKLLHLCLLF